MPLTPEPAPDGSRITDQRAADLSSTRDTVKGGEYTLRISLALRIDSMPCSTDSNGVVR
jgi:hypothetical protein